jgi:hypothetical protein
MAGYEKGLQDTSHRVKSAEEKIASWRRLALACGGMGMVLVIVAVIESYLLAHLR